MVLFTRTGIGGPSAWGLENYEGQDPSEWALENYEDLWKRCTDRDLDYLSMKRIYSFEALGLAMGTQPMLVQTMNKSHFRNMLWDNAYYGDANIVDALQQDLVSDSGMRNELSRWVYIVHNATRRYTRMMRRPRRIQSIRFQR